MENIKNEEIAMSYIESYDNYIMKHVHRVIQLCYKLEFDDTKQQIILSVLQAAGSYDRNLNDNPAAYFSKVVVNSTKNIIKSYWCDKNRANIESISLEEYVKESDESLRYIDMIPDDPGSFLAPEEYFKYICFNDNLKSILDRVPRLYCNIFAMYLKGHRIEQIAIFFKKSKKTIYNIITFVRCELESLS